MKQVSYTKIILASTLVVAIFSILYVFLVEEVKMMAKQKVDLESEISLKMNLLTEKEAVRKQLADETRISAYASEQLGMVKALQVFSEIKIDKEKSRDIINAVESIYE